METQIKLWKYSFFALLFLASSVTLSLFFENSNLKEERASYRIQAEKSDTVFKILPQKEIQIIKAKPKIVYLRDTVYETRAFQAKLDTIIIKDTLKAEYSFPENLFSLNYKHSPDSLIYITNTKTVPKEIKWWEYGALILGGIVVGFVIK